ncbi:MAG TPA: hypothetical protein ENG92_01045 [Thiolapillus brandeum]|uniref:C-type lysozyme inhibitor domain-containing protein n=1 Tax=Thiolapillus brandeum TaxID=1076588 RepID=A0A831JWF8_9GAMM|nr:hypothetical protein [Thiolapillus brandeum]
MNSRLEDIAKRPLSQFGRGRAIITALLLAIALSASADDTMLQYQCDNDYALRVELNEKQARVFLHDRTLELPRQKDMKGERYLSNDRQALFLRKGRNAVLAVSAGHGMLRCTEVDKVQE